MSLEHRVPMMHLFFLHEKLNPTKTGAISQSNCANMVTVNSCDGLRADSINRVLRSIHGMQCTLHKISRPSYSILPFRYQPPGLRSPTGIYEQAVFAAAWAVNGVIDFYLTKINQEVVTSIFDNFTSSNRCDTGHLLNKKKRPSLP